MQTNERSRHRNRHSVSFHILIRKMVLVDVVCTVNCEWELGKWWKFGLRVECISAFKIKIKIKIEKERKALQTGSEIVSQKELIELECFSILLW